MERRITIQWTNTAKEQLAALPLEVRRGLLKKAGGLKDCSDPKSAHKPLRGPLEGFCRITNARYRAVYCVEEDELASGDVYVRVKICFVAAGKRKERDRKDIYKIAEKMLNLGLVDLAEGEEGKAES
jgi:mRNA interferase RelE/StbE